MTPQRLRPLVLRLVAGSLALAGVQLVLSLALAPQYAQWFRQRHPGTPDLAVYLALALRAAASLLWVASYRRFVRLVSTRTRGAVGLLVAYAVVTVAGYGWLVAEGGPWWLTGARAAQLAVAVVVLALVTTPAARAGFGPRTPVSD